MARSDRYFRNTFRIRNLFRVRVASPKGEGTQGSSGLGEVFSPNPLLIRPSAPSTERGIKRKVLAIFALMRRREYLELLTKYALF